ncbi:iron siderophore-binding protein [Rivularia sp. IAM M-261]|nr:iron siderophore-binding protein [Calothrix sp. PCC 7716]GJD15939.1 iron siderophore-binding protein [Rivularia sp. IAM M-261]
MAGLNLQILLTKFQNIKTYCFCTSVLYFICPNRKFKLFLLGIAIILTISGCRHNLQIPNSTASSPLLSPAATRVIKHAYGETKIPIKPQRIITLHDSTILDPVLALGVKPIGAAISPEKGILIRGITNEQAKDIQPVGNAFEPSLEKILMLKPDLIIGREYQKNIYNLLTSIAPTVLVDWGSFSSFQDNFRYVAQVLGKDEQAKQVLNNYQARVQEFRRRMGKRLEKIEVSVIGVSGQNIKSLNRDAVFNQIIDDIGVKKSLIQRNQKERYLQLSIEFLTRYDADVLFVINEPNSEPLSYLKNPIWFQLKAVKNRQVYEVQPSIWFAGGPLGANMILDDLFKYLVK